MAQYFATVNFVDEINGETTRRFEGDFADDAAASTAMGLLLADANALSTAEVSGVLHKPYTIASTAAAGSRVFENARIGVELDDTQKYSLDFPSPLGTVFSGNTLIITDTNITNWIANFQSSAGWLVSDGQEIDSILKGKRVFLASGKTNLE